MQCAWMVHHKLCRNSHFHASVFMGTISSVESGSIESRPALRIIHSNVNTDSGKRSCCCCNFFEMKCFSTVSITSWYLRKKNRCISKTRHIKRKQCVRRDAVRCQCTNATELSFQSRRVAPLWCSSSYWKTNMWMIWQIVCFQHLLLSHQRHSLFFLRLSATPPVWHCCLRSFCVFFTLCLIALLWSIDNNSIYKAVTWQNKSWKNN